VAPITIGIGVILILLGAGGYAATDFASVTALIPAFFGIALAVLGVLARQEKLRKHAMHTAVLVGLIGLIGAAVMVVRALGAPAIERPVAFWMQVAMGVLCGVFVGLCVKSFIDARRKQGPQATE
jgi:zinc transporter ZupT